MFIFIQLYFTFWQYTFLPVLLMKHTILKNVLEVKAILTTNKVNNKIYISYPSYLIEFKSYRWSILIKSKE